MYERIKNAFTFTHLVAMEDYLNIQDYLQSHLNYILRLSMEF